MFEGIHRGIVRDNLDPDKKGRVKVAIPSIGPADDTNAEFISPWYRVASPPGAAVTYAVGELVLVAFGNMDDVNDGYVIGSIPRIDNAGDPKVPATAKGKDDKSTLGDQGMDQAVFVDEANVTIEQATTPQSTYSPDTASAGAEIKERDGLREEFDPGNGRWRVLTKEGSQMELNSTGLNVKAATVHLTSASRFTTIAKGDAKQVVVYNRFAKIGKTDFYRSPYRKDIIDKLEQTILVEKKTVKLSSEIKIGGTLVESVGVSTKRNTGLTSTENAARIVHNATTSMVNKVVGAGNPTAMGALSPSLTDILIYGNRMFALAEGNLDILFPTIGLSSTPGLFGTRVRIMSGAPTLLTSPNILLSTDPVVTPEELDFHLLRASMLEKIIIPAFTALITYATAAGAAYAPLAAPAAELIAVLSTLSGLLVADIGLLTACTTQFIASRIASE